MRWIQMMDMVVVNITIRAGAWARVQHGLACRFAPEPNRAGGVNACMLPVLIEAPSVRFSAR